MYGGHYGQATRPYERESTVRSCSVRTIAIRDDLDPPSEGTDRQPTVRNGLHYTPPSIGEGIFANRVTDRLWSTFWSCSGLSKNSHLLGDGEMDR